MFEKWEITGSFVYIMSSLHCNMRCLGSVNAITISIENFKITNIGHAGFQRLQKKKKNQDPYIWLICYYHEALLVLSFLPDN